LLEERLVHLKRLIWIRDRRRDGSLSRGDMCLGSSIVSFRNGGEASSQYATKTKCAEQIAGHSRLLCFRAPDDEFTSPHFAALVLSVLKFLRIGFSVAAIPSAIFSEPPTFG
jgi:hypothetical protein